MFIHKKIPETLQHDVSFLLKQWQEKIITLATPINLPQRIEESIPLVFCSSQFVAQRCIKNPTLLLDLVQTGDLTAAYDEQHYLTALQNLSIASEADLMTQLRLFRNREMVRIAWRDVTHWADLNETLLDLSLLAEACIQHALAFLYQQACDKRGIPLLSNGDPQQLIVLGMGKLGAFELNYSSDIDLIFAYAEEGVLSDRKATTYGEFFTRLCQNLVKVLDEITVDGFVFRTDTRLRPFGESGAIVMTFDGMENYYQTQAREWERYAMIKARQVAGDFKSGQYLMTMLQAFVYRRYLDYGAFEELRSLKAQITQELRRKDRMDNIKLGPGGIREIEFIGQAFQLIRGGNEKSLQVRGILAVLRRLGELELLTTHDAEQLIKAYGFLRRVENHIQQYQDKQTHDLPTDSTVQQILAYSMGYHDWQHFKLDLDQVRASVHSVFDQVFSLSKSEQTNPYSQQLWTAVADEHELFEALHLLGFSRATESLAAIRHFKQANTIRRLTNKGAAVLDRLMPTLISALPTVTNPDETLKRILHLFEAVAGRNVYLSLLAENPEALTQLLRLSSASPWLCDYLSRYPVLFDELLDTRSLYEPLSRTALDTQLEQLLSAINIDDLERLMIVLREFKQLNVLRVAAADIMGVIPLMVVSDYLTYIAESIVTQVVARAWLILKEKHGLPPATDDQHIGFAVLGFGKLGGIELGYGSDLDLVFIYDCPNGLAMTDGEKPITCTQFYGRLGQKVRHILDTRLLSGILYEVDMRLRPSGDSGLLVAHINTYESYLREQAWTWEHQALVRGRFIAGDQRLQTAYANIRHTILSLPRDYLALKTEVREMREKMRAALLNQEVRLFDLKQSKGGIADIEFIVQFGILALASEHPNLTTYTDNVRLLEGLDQQGFISHEKAKLLKTAYCTFRDYGHKQVLQGDRAVIDIVDVVDIKTQVEQCWDELMGVHTNNPTSQKSVEK